MEKNWILGAVMSVAGVITLMIVGGPVEDLAVFATVAVGWGLIVWRLGTLFRVRIREAQAAEAGLLEMSHEFHRVLDQITETFEDQFAKGQHELEQLRLLLRDAVERLAHAFAFLKEQIQAQQELLQEVAGHSGSLMRHGSLLANVDGPLWDDSDDSPAAAAARQTQTLVTEVVAMSDRLALGVAQLWRVKGELDTTLGEAVTALQFEDITAQLANHLEDRVKYLETLLSGLMKIDEGLGEDLDADRARTNYESRLRRMREALDAASLLVAQADHVAVQQERLTPGEVELF